MNTFTFMFGTICVCCAAQAFAIDPPPELRPADSTADVPVKAPASQPDGIKADVTSSQPEKIPPDNKNLTDDEAKRLLAQGYKPVGRDGDVRYCRSETATGTRFAVKVCKTVAQIKQQTQDSKDMLTTAQKVGGCRANSSSC